MIPQRILAPEITLSTQSPSLLAVIRGQRNVMAILKPGDAHHCVIFSMWDTLTMERNIKKRYQIVRVLEDGARIAVSSLEDPEEARNLIASLNEFWPGDYSILLSDTDLMAQASR